jgi:hypothetical protein
MGLPQDLQNLADSAFTAPQCPQLRVAAACAVCVSVMEAPQPLQNLAPSRLVVPQARHAMSIRNLFVDGQNLKNGWGCAHRSSSDEPSGGVVTKPVVGLVAVAHAPHKIWKIFPSTVCKFL